ncbi:hypothetical protein MYX64_07465 [Nitrospinae bacterium AH_259_B05_G02_I21]|nr:hypothetical protein [Nitrospinae bacterium AH_259_B05_G02_I21]MDA2932442.1 hypothetical protein [Nitrospinae bacterium AH-259-F20]
MMKRHPKTPEILAEMERWAKKKAWRIKVKELYEELDRAAGQYMTHDYVLWAYGLEDPMPNGQPRVIHFIPTGCESKAVYAYCAYPNSKRVIKHKIGNCHIAKEIIRS